MREKDFSKKIFLVCYLTLFLLVMWAKSGFADNYYPDGFDGAKWGMSFDEVLDVIEEEGKKILISATYIKARGYIFGYETNITYEFRGDKLKKIWVSPIKIKVRNAGNVQYEKIRSILTKIYGVPSQTGLTPDRDEYYASWRYPNSEVAMEIESIFAGVEGFRHEGIRKWETTIKITAPSPYDLFKGKMVELQSATSGERY